MEIGEKLRLARQNSGKTQEQVGEAIAARPFPTGKTAVHCPMWSA